MPKPKTHDGTITVALLGNPNSGKSTLFNALAGVHQRVGNYPGVTVEKRLGRLDFRGQRFTLVDLPGTYSLAPRSPDEMVAVDVLLGRRQDVAQPDVILCILDASNLERHLYLVSQVLELGRPVVLALNMIDLAQQRGIQIDAARLSQRLGVAAISIQANRKVGLEELKQALLAAAGSEGASVPSPFPPAFQEEVARLRQLVRDPADGTLPRYLIERLLLDTGGYLEHIELAGPNGQLPDALTAARTRLSAAGCAVPAVEALSRYRWVGEVLDGVVRCPTESPVTWSDRLDRVLTHKVAGTLIFALLMVLVFQSIFAWAVPVMDGIDWLVGQSGALMGAALPAGALQSLVVDGAIAGVGGVLVFLPQIFILFLFIAVLEDCGYMARAAYLMDKLMSRVGLSGKSFIPLLSSFACAIPGVMAARVIESRRDRLVTILVAPLMSCSARLPVYSLLIAAFIPNRRWLGGWIGLQGVTMFAMYLVGIVTAVLMALVLKRTILRGETPPFVMELPSYKIPSFRTVLWRMLDRGWAFVRRAGTLILAVAVLVWAAAYFPHPPELKQQVTSQFQAHAASHAPHEALTVQQATELSNRIAGAYVQQSILGRLGQLIEPLVKPLGWDWRIGCAAIASFPAREVVIGALGVIYNLGAEQEDTPVSLASRLKSVTWDGTDRPVYNIPVALSLMVFYALCAQCAATLVIIRRETGSWRWPLLTFFYMTTLAYLAALVTYQVGMRIAA